MKPQLLYPYDGLQTLGTYNVPLVKAIRVDAGAQTTGTDAILQFHKGDVILGFVARFTEAVTSAGAATLQLGFTGKTMLSTAAAKATLVVGYPLGPDESADAAVYVLPADDTFDSIVGTADLTAGKFDLFVIYLPAITEDLSTDVFEKVTA